MNYNFVTSYDISFSNKQVKYGQTSLKLSYHFGGWLSGNGAMFIIFKEKLKTDVMPCKFGMWVYGDGKSPWLRAVFIDGNGERKTTNLTSDNINWRGWRYVETPIDSNWALPIKLQQIYAVETNKLHQGDPSYTGEIYFDRLRFVYVDNEDLIGPIFNKISPEQKIVYKDTFLFTTKITDEISGIDPKSIILKINHQEVPYQFCEKRNELSYQFSNVEQGAYHIFVEAKDYAGNISIPPIDKKIIVDLSPDVEKPRISDITPTETSIIYTNTPRIAFKLVDEKSGVDETNIHVSLNGRKLAVIYDERTGWGYAVSLEKLNDGKHNFSITAKDRAGNQLDPIKREFTIEGIGEPKNRENFSISIIPDIHSNQYGQVRFLNVINEASDFVLQMGDLVDQATEDEYKELKRNLNILEDKVMLTIPGNHEAFQDNLDLYMNIFGSPTYHLEYGNALFIFLNSAYEQSISISDSTQFDYLNKLLNNNKKKHIIIATHVPTKDDFGTGHEMNKSDSQKLEQILSTYKKKNKDVQITVLFGHLHVLQQWEIDDVHYIITGNAAEKGYVSNKYGNILGHGMLSVLENRITYRYHPDLVNISIVNDNSKTNQLLMQNGTSRKLHVDGQVSKLNSRYKIRLTNFDLIEKIWSSDQVKVVEVNNEGVIKAVALGNACITVEISGEKTCIQVLVIDNKGENSDYLY